MASTQNDSLRPLHILEDGQGVIDPDTYFQRHSAPKNLAENESRIREFVNFHLETDRRVVLVTSGGTTVPLENQTVRFIDNFSAGTRGATSAEYFLEQGYAVIFMHRQHSLQPYSRHYTHSTNCFLDLLSLDESGVIRVDPRYTAGMKEVMLKYNLSKKNNTLLLVEFTTVTDYLFLLRSATHIMAVLREKAMYYLAAAVSDFFIPAEKMAEHKIQSGEGALTLKLDQVPKFLKPLVSNWAERGFIVSFKLETDANLLVSKARTALMRYGHQVVIGNILHTRKRVVTMISRDEEHEIRLSDDEVAAEVEIESRIVPELVRWHDRWIEERGNGDQGSTKG